MKRAKGKNRYALLARRVGVAGMLLLVSLPMDVQAEVPVAPKHLVARADRDDPEGVRMLGELYWRHANDPESLRKAVFWLERAATLDDHPAQALASMFYQNGVGVPKNPQRATWFAMHAARSGDPVLQFRYAQLLEAGYGVPRNIAEANSWYRRAAAQGHRSSATALGQSLARQTTNLDALHEAVRYLSMAARMGDAQAKTTLQGLSPRLAKLKRHKPNVNIRKSPSLNAEVVAKTLPANTMYNLGEVTEGWIEVYRPEDYMTGYAYVSAITGS